MRKEKKLLNNLIKKILAGTLAAAMAFSAVPASITYADENAVFSESNADDTAADASAAEDAAGNAGESAGEDTPDVWLSYAAVGSASVAAPGTEDIVVSLGTAEEVTVTDAVLTYTNEETGEVLTSTPVQEEDGAWKFSIDFADDAEAHVYDLTSVSYETDSENATITFAEAGIEPKFAVNTYVETNPDEVLESSEGSTEGTSDDGLVSVTALDEDGNEIAVDNIEDAIDEAQANTDVSAAAADTTDTSVFDENIKEEGEGTVGGANRNVVVVLDPGHGGADSGATGYGLQEKNLTMAIANACKAELQKYEGITVYMTRQTADEPLQGEIYEDLENRTAIAESYHADLFFCIHINAGGGTGAEVYYPTQNYKAGIGIQGSDVAVLTQNQLVALGLADRGVFSGDHDDAVYPDGSAADGLAVIRGCKRRGIPAVLVEHGFIDNGSDVARFLGSSAGTTKLGVADATAIAQYFGLTQNAATSGGLDYSAVFDADYYANRYPDLYNLYGHDEQRLFQHFLNNGMKEGRQASAEFDPAYYKQTYTDLAEQFGNNNVTYYVHYIRCGKAEGRKGAGEVKLACYRGVDYSSVYNFDYYTSHNSDVAKAFSMDPVRTIAHFVYNGMKEGRQANSEFDPEYYQATYSDLRKAFGNNMKLYYQHYMQYGKKEGRKGNGSGTDTDYEDDTTVTLYRLYFPGTREHFYTKDLNERRVLLTKGWQDEGVAWLSPEHSSQPVYRLFNQYSSDHHYTADYNEYITLIRQGWTGEGICWYGATGDAAAVPVYREFYPYITTGAHNYTTDAYEHSVLTTQRGWRNEGIAWYGLAG